MGLVVFNDHARVVFPLEQVAQLSMEKVKYELDILSAKGATNMVRRALLSPIYYVDIFFQEAGLKLAAQQFSKKTQIGTLLLFRKSATRHWPVLIFTYFLSLDFPKRIIFMTDATPSEYEAIRLEEQTILNTNRYFL